MAPTMYGLCIAKTVYIHLIPSPSAPKSLQNPTRHIHNNNQRPKHYSTRHGQPTIAHINSPLAITNRHSHILTPTREPYQRRADERQDSAQCDLRALKSSRNAFLTDSARDDDAGCDGDGPCDQALDPWLDGHAHLTDPDHLASDSADDAS